MQEDGDGEPVVADTLRTGYTLQGQGAATGHGEGHAVAGRSDMAPQREWFDTDYYEVLGVPTGASEKDITRAYRKLAKEHHPDANPGNTQAEERFKEISAAYDVLGDADKRKEYDEVREMVASGAMRGGFGPAAVPAGSRASSRSSSTRAPGSATSSAACSGAVAPPVAGHAARGRPRAGPQRGADLETELHLDFLDAVHGVTTQRAASPRDAACSVCHGSGAKPGTAPDVVPRLQRHRRDRWSTRARSRSRRCARRAAGAARSSRTRARTATARGRAPRARREGPHPGRRRRRPAHPREGPRRGRRARRAARRPLRGRARRGRTRSSGARAREPHGARADHVRRGRAGRRR